MNNTLIRTFKNKNSPPFALIWLGWIICSVLGIIDGIINISTLCFYFPNLQMKWIFWWSEKQLKFKR